jgi:hypothetical protein
MVCSLSFRRQARVCARLAEEFDDQHLAERLKKMASDLLAKADSLEELPSERARFSGLIALATGFSKRASAHARARAFDRDIAQSVFETETHILCTLGGKLMSSENVTVAEVLALKAIVRVLLAEKIRDFKDQSAAAFELAASCSEIVNEAHLSGPDPEGTKQEALRHLDNIFGALKKA